jgi:small subunit ribosomal protein S3
MGQKVNPVGMRVGIIRDWESRWYAEKEYGALLQEDIKIRAYLSKKLAKASVSRIEIERSKHRVEIIIRAGKAGEIIGQEGKGVEALKKDLAKLLGDKQVKMTILAVANPSLDATLVARLIADQLEQRASFRIAQKRAIQQTMRAGAKGIKTLVSGRLGGNDIARSEGYSEGVVPLHTLRSDIDYAIAEAHTTYGRLGVKVWICRGEVLPGQMVSEPEAPKDNGRFDRRDRGPRRDRRDNERRDARPSSAMEAQKTADAPKAEAIETPAVDVAKAQAAAAVVETPKVVAPVEPVVETPKALEAPVEAVVETPVAPAAESLDAPAPVVKEASPAKPAAAKKPAVKKAKADAVEADAPKAPKKAAAPKSADKAPKAKAVKKEEAE